MGSAFGAGGGADMLQDIIRRKVTEAFAKQKLAEDMRQADMNHSVQQEQLGQGQQRIGLQQQELGQQTRAYEDAAPMRAANLGHVEAETADLQGRPQMAEAARAAQLAAAEQQRGFTHTENEANRGNAVRIANINGANAARTATIRTQGGPSGEPAITPQQQNEVQDAIKLIDQMAGDTSLDASVGMLDQYGAGKLQDPNGVNRFASLHDQLVGKLALAQAGKLKGQGQISDKERALLSQAATSLRRGLSEKDYRTELAKIRDQFARMQSGGTQTAAPPADPDPLGLFKK